MVVAARLIEVIQRAMPHPKRPLTCVSRGYLVDIPFPRVFHVDSWEIHVDFWCVVPRESVHHKFTYFSRDFGHCISTGPKSCGKVVEMRWIFKFAFTCWVSPKNPRVKHVFFSSLLFTCYIDYFSSCVARNNIHEFSPSPLTGGILVEKTWIFQILFTWDFIRNPP